MAAEVLARGGVEVTILDHMPSPARKFLLAGRGGLNLTHSEPLETFLTRYGEAKDFLEPAIRAFLPQAVIDWCPGLGIETFVGSSGRVFPKQMKASPLLRAWLRRLLIAALQLLTIERAEHALPRPRLMLGMMRRSRGFILGERRPGQPGRQRKAQNRATQVSFECHLSRSA